MSTFILTETNVLSQDTINQYRLGATHLSYLGNESQIRNMRVNGIKSAIAMDADVARVINSIEEINYYKDVEYFYITKRFNDLDCMMKFANTHRGLIKHGVKTGYLDYVLQDLTVIEAHPLELYEEYLKFNTDLTIEAIKFAWCN